MTVSHWYPWMVLVAVKNSLNYWFVRHVFLQEELLLSLSSKLPKCHTHSFRSLMENFCFFAFVFVYTLFQKWLALLVIIHFARLDFVRYSRFWNLINHCLLQMSVVELSRATSTSSPLAWLMTGQWEDGYLLSGGYSSNGPFLYQRREVSGL